jgi:hypothetical protein
MTVVVLKTGVAVKTKTYRNHVSVHALSGVRMAPYARLEIDAKRFGGALRSSFHW